MRSIFCQNDGKVGKAHGNGDEIWISQEDKERSLVGR